MLHSIKINSPSINIVVYVPRLICVLLCTHEHGPCMHSWPEPRRAGPEEERRADHRQVVFTAPP